MTSEPETVVTETINRVCAGCGKQVLDTPYTDIWAGQSHVSRYHPDCLPPVFGRNCFAEKNAEIARLTSQVSALVEAIEGLKTAYTTAITLLGANALGIVDDGALRKAREALDKVKR